MGKDKRASGEVSAKTAASEDQKNPTHRLVKEKSGAIWDRETEQITAGREDPWSKLDRKFQYYLSKQQKMLDWKLRQSKMLLENSVYLEDSYKSGLLIWLGGLFLILLTIGNTPLPIGASSLAHNIEDSVLLVGPILFLLVSAALWDEKWGLLIIILLGLAISAGIKFAQIGLGGLANETQILFVFKHVWILLFMYWMLEESLMSVLRAMLTFVGLWQITYHVSTYLVLLIELDWHRLVW